MKRTTALASLLLMGSCNALEAGPVEPTAAKMDNFEEFVAADSFSQLMIDFSDLKNAEVGHIYHPQMTDPASPIDKDAPVIVLIPDLPFSKKIQENIYLTLQEVYGVAPFDTLGLQHHWDPSLTAKELLPPGWFMNWERMNASQRMGYGWNKVRRNGFQGGEMFEVSMDDAIETYGLDFDEEVYKKFMVFEEDKLMEGIHCQYSFMGMCQLPEELFISQRIPESIEEIMLKNMDSWVEKIFARADKTKSKIVPIVGYTGFSYLVQRLHERPLIVLEPKGFSKEITYNGQANRMHDKDTSFMDWWYYWFRNGHRRYHLD